MPAVMELNEAMFEQAVEQQSNALVLIEFYAPWCPHCEEFATTLEAVAQEYQGRLKVYRINVDKNQSLAQRYEVEYLPTLLLFQNGKPVETQVGAVPKESLVQLVDKSVKVSR